MAGFTKSLKEQAKDEKKKLRELETKQEKLEYIWDYYKVHIIATIITIIIIISTIRGCIRNNYETILYVAYVNLSSVDVMNETHKLEDSINELLGADGKSQKPVIYTYLYINPNQYTEEGHASESKIVTITAVRDCDLFLSDNVFMETYAHNDFFLILDDAMSPELYEKVKDRLLYYEDGMGEQHIYGIDLSNLPYMTDYLQVSNDKPIFSIVVNAPHVDESLKLLEYIVDYK